MGLIGVSVVGALLASALFIGMPSNVLSLRDGSPVRWLYTGFMPQGWAFFTKPPNDPEFHAYNVDEDGNIASASLFPNARAENLFGIARGQRAQGPEFASLGRQVTDWIDCNELFDGEDCVVAAASLPATSVDSPMPNPTLCGSILLAETSPVPWQFRNDYRGWRLESRVAHLEVDCE